MVEQEYEASSALLKLRAAGKITRIEAMPSWNNRLALFGWLGQRLPRLVAELQPSVVLMNNWHSFHQKILSRLVRKLCPQTPIVVCLSVHHPVTDFETTGLHLIHARKKAWRKRWPWLPGPMSDQLHDIWGWWVGVRDFALLPMLFTGGPVHQTYCPWNGRVPDKNVGDLYDAIVCYSPVERQNYAMEAPDLDQIHLIRHPMSDTATRALFGTEEKGNRIVALPSSCLDYENGQSHEQQVDHLVTVWGNALEIIQKKSHQPEIWWKLHPSFVDDPVMLDVTRKLADRLPGFQSMTGKITAEQMIVQSSIVVGDVSSVLLWSMRLGQRLTISLDLFDMPGGDEMSYYPGIKVIRSWDELPDLDDAVLVDHGRQDTAYPTIGEFLSGFRREGPAA
ncbi:hypothetical protein GCM10027396_08610 [Insolitispirillum peregrinum]